jgi:hypothetical protein
LAPSDQAALNTLNKVPVMRYHASNQLLVECERIALRDETSCAIHSLIHRSEGWIHGVNANLVD